MSFSSPKSVLYTAALAALPLLIAGCSGDGNNAKDNPIFGPQYDLNAPTGTITPTINMSDVGAAFNLDTEDLGSVDDNVQAVVDVAGNVTVAWTQERGSSTNSINLWASRYTMGGGWSAPKLMDSGGGDVKSFKLVVDSSKNVMLVWTQAEILTFGSPAFVERTDLHANYFNANSLVWEGDETVVVSSLTKAQTEKIEDIAELELVVDSAGVVTAVWTQHNGAYYDIYANRATAGAWGTTPQLLDSEDLGDVSNIHVTESNSDVFVVWTQSDGVFINLWGLKFIYTGPGADGTWSNLSEIDTLQVDQTAVIDGKTVSITDVDGNSVRLVADSAKNATLVWAQYDGTYNNLWRARLPAGGSWSDINTLEDENLGNASTPQLVLLPNSEVMALWAQNNSTVSNIWARLYNGTWQTAEIIDANDNADASFVKAIVDGSNHVVATWAQADDSAETSVENLWARRFDASVGAGAWEDPIKIEFEGDGDVEPPTLVVDNSDHVSAIWRQLDIHGFSLWASRLDPATGLWTIPELLEDIDANSATNLQVGINAVSGDISLVWRQTFKLGDQLDSEPHLIGKSYIAGGSGWGDVYKVEPLSQNGGYSPRLLVDANGNRTVFWLVNKVLDTNQTTLRDLWVNRY